MTFAPRVALLLAGLLLGLLAGVASIAVHQSWLGLLLATVSSVAGVHALRQWLPRAALTFTAGWLVPLLAGLKGRGEGDYAVSGNLLGYVLVALGFVMLVAGLVSGLAPATRHDSGSVGAPT